MLPCQDFADSTQSGCLLNPAFGDGDFIVSAGVVRAHEAFGGGLVYKVRIRCGRIAEFGADKPSANELIADTHDIGGLSRRSDVDAARLEEGLARISHATE